MSEFARVDAIESLKEFRACLCMFAEAVNTGMIEAESEVQGTTGWLKHDQQAYWNGQVRKYTQLVAQAKLALKRKEQQKTPLGGKYSCVDEKEALAVVQKRLDEAEQKQTNVRRWIVRLEKETFSYKGVVQGMAQVISADIPQALARLDNIIASLESYVSLAAPAESAKLGAKSAAPGVAREEKPSAMARVPASPDSVTVEDCKSWRTKTPDKTVRNPITIKKTTINWSAGTPLKKSSLQVLAGVQQETAGFAPGDKVLLAEGVWKHERIYLERVKSCPKGDSGWYVGFADDIKVRSYIALTVRDLLDGRPDWTKILELPPGSLIVLNSTSIEALFDARDEKILPGPQK